MIYKVTATVMRNGALISVESAEVCGDAYHTRYSSLAAALTVAHHLQDSAESVGLKEVRYGAEISVDDRDAE